MEDSASTIAGGGAGIALLLTVRCEAIPSGEAVKVGVALALAIMGYVMSQLSGKVLCAGE